MLIAAQVGWWWSTWELMTLFYFSNTKFFLNHCENTTPTMNMSFIISVKIIKLCWSGYYVPSTVPSTLYSCLMTCLLSRCYWSRFDVLRHWDPMKQATWPRTQGNRDGRRRSATPWRYLLHILFGPFINIIVREHVYFIVTCSILVHPVFLEKWISLSLFIQDNKTKQKGPRTILVWWRPSWL